MATLNIAYSPQTIQKQLERLDTYDKQDNPRELGVWAIYDRLAEAGTDFDTLKAADLLPYVDRNGIHRSATRLLRDLRNRHAAKTNPKPKRKSRAGTKPCPVRMLQLAEAA